MPDGGLQDNLPARVTRWAGWQPVYLQTEIPQTCEHCEASPASHHVGLARPGDRARITAEVSVCNLCLTVLQDVVTDTWEVLADG